MGIESSAHTHTKCDKDQKVNIALIARICYCATLPIDLLWRFFFQLLSLSPTWSHNYDEQTEQMRKSQKRLHLLFDVRACGWVCECVCLIFFYRCSRSTIISIRSCTCSDLMACLFYCYVCSVYLSGIGSAMIARHMEERIRARDRNCVAHWIHRALHTQIVYTLNHSRVKSFSSHINHPHITSHALFFFCYCNRQRQFPLLPLSHFHSHLAFPFSLHRSEHVWHIPNLYDRHIKFYSHLHMHK